MSSVLVTGASGFVGRHLVGRLWTAGFAVIPHTSAEGDIASCDFPHSVTHVVHLAALTFVPDSYQHTRDFYRVNVLGTVNVLEHCRRTGAALVFLSSYVYGAPERLPVDENHPVCASNPYGHTKLLAEQTCRFYAEQFGVPLTVVRPFNLYGEGQSEKFLIPSLIRQTLSPSAAEMVVADERPRRDYIHVEDVADLLVKMVHTTAPGTYNAGSGVSHSVTEIAALINTISVVKKPLRSLEERRPNEIPDTVADITRARRTFDWEPRISLHAGLERMLLAHAGAEP
jgi:nucleoside-diphosphate-sugar epimerase